MKKILILISAVILIPLVAGAEPRTGWVMCSPDSEVNIRAKPRKSSDIVAHVYMSDEIKLDGKKSGKWLHIIIPCEAGEGWIRGDYVSLSEPEAITNNRYRVCKVRTRVRSSAGGRVIKFLKKGTEVTVHIMTEKWCVTDKGFISTSCLEEVQADD